MAFRSSSSSSFQLLATLVLFALLISPMFASPLVDENQSHDHAAAENQKQPLVVGEKHSGKAKHSDEASPLEDDKHIISALHGGYGGLGGGYGGLGGGGYGRGGCMGMRRASSCVCHCMNGRVATPQEVLQSANKKP